MDMHRSLTTAKMAVLWLLLAPFSFALAGPGADETIEKARQRLQRDDPRGALTLLEAALPAATGKDRAAIVEQLRSAYTAAIKKANAEGKPAEAEGYRDDLEILTRAPRKDLRAAPPSKPAAAPVQVEKPAPALVTAAPPESPPVQPLPASEPLAAPPAARGEQPRGDGSELPSKPGGLFLRNDPTPEQPTSAAPVPSDVPKPESPPARPTASVAEADAAFVAKHYEQAGRLYAELARAGALPDDRRDHWLYCRAVAVVQRINARPNAAQEWVSIEAEVEAIRALNPQQWLTEYLGKCVAERRKTVRPPGSR